MVALTILAGVGALALVAAGEPSTEASLGEPSCILDTMQSTAHEALVEAIAAGDRARSGAAIQENAGAIQDAVLSCTEKFQWSKDQRRMALQAFEYDFRLEASLIRLRANGLAEDEASAMFEALPAGMHEAIFGRRQMTREEMDVLQPAFERLVDRLDGPDGKALSEYITARAGYGFYARELLAP